MIAYHNKLKFAIVKSNADAFGEIRTWPAGEIKDFERVPP